MKTITTALILLAAILTGCDGAPGGDSTESGSSPNSTDPSSGETALSFADQRTVNQLNAARRRLSELSEKKAHLESQRADLALFQIADAKFAWVENQSFPQSQAAVTIETHNGLDQAISCVYVYVTLISEGRSIPWAEGKFRLEVPGGLEPGESQQLRAIPADNAWEEALRSQQGLLVHAEVLNVVGADGEIIFPDEMSQHELGILEEAPGEIKELEPLIEAIESRRE